MDLNKLQDLFEKYKPVELKGFSTHNGDYTSNEEPASWDDNVWYFTDINNAKTRVLSCKYSLKNKAKISHDINVTDEYSLEKNNKYLLKIFIINTFSLPVSTSTKQAMIIDARKILTYIEDHYSSIFDRNLNNDSFLTIRVKHNRFYKFCYEYKIFNPNIRFTSQIDKRARTGEARSLQDTKKLPDEHSILALGEIFQAVFKDVNNNGRVLKGSIVNINSAFTSTMAALSLASPNRAKAEQLLLNNKKLQQHQKDKEIAYYLNYPGSKGYKDNEKHILKAMYPQINKSVNFFIKNGERGRILCSFYEDSSQTLSELTKNFTIDKHLLKHLDINAIPNIFQLGYALGFYRADLEVKVVIKEFKSDKDVPHIISPKHTKTIPIYQVDNHHIVYKGKSNPVGIISKLFGCEINDNKRIFGLKKLASIAEIQNMWIRYYTEKCLSNFPFSCTNTDRYIKLKHALFCILGSEIPSKGGDIGSNSFFYIKKLNSLGTLFNNNLTGSVISKSIFVKYEFSEELEINSHSLRHYSNTLASMSNIPIPIITAWSGRVDPNQTVTYIHTADETKAAQVKAIISPEADTSIDIRVITTEELATSSNLYATVTSTGVCIQDLNVTPCHYLNTFISQCFLCPEACHVAGDEKSISLLSKDCEYQTKRLSKLDGDKRIATSKAMQDWYKIHSQNTYILNSLIDIMKKEPKGTIIKFSSKYVEFRLTDLATQIVRKIPLTLPKPKTNFSLVNMSDTKNEFTNNTELSDIFKHFGISKEKEI